MLDRCGGYRGARLAQAFVALGCFLFSVPGFAGQHYALLVGVSDYPNLGPKQQLKGPANDVVLMREVLRAKGFADDHVRVLADGAEGAREPNRAAIMAAMTEITGKAGRGDYVLLYFAGHGSKQPEDKARTDRGHKPNGMNEIFLPKDVGKWDGGTGAIRNAIADFEMNGVVTGLRNKGAFVWAIFDSCHSASMTRGVEPDDVRFRQVDPGDLGMPLEVIARAERDAAADESSNRGESNPDSRLGPPPKLKPDAAGFVAFYAAQTTEMTPEMPMPKEALDRKLQGLFSFTLAQAIRTHGSITYKQLGDYVLQQYGKLANIPVTPQVEGTDLDAPVFGDGNAKKVRQWPIEMAGSQVKINAGALNQIAAGALFAVLANPLAEDKDALAYLRADSVKVFESQLAPASKGPDGKEYKSRLTSSGIPKGAYARLLQSPPDFSLTVALPPKSQSEGIEEARAREILARLQASPPPTLRVTWVAAGQPADLRLSFNLDEPRKLRSAPRQLWLLSPTGQLVETGAAKTLSIELSQPDIKLADKVEDRLTKIARFVNLMRLSAQMAGASGGAAMEIQAFLTRKGSDQQKPMPTGGVPKLYAGDVIEFKMSNKGRQAADVTLLFLDSAYGIETMYPPPGRLNRIEAGGNDSSKILIDDDTIGVERLLAISVQVQQKQAAANFSFLAQESLARTRSVTSPLEALFAEAAFGSATTRSGAPLVQADANATQMLLFSWETAKAKP